MTGMGAEMRFDEAERARLERALQARAPGAFHFPEIYGEGWDRLYIGDRVKLGRTFLNAVRAGDFPGVEDTGRKQDSGRVYRWNGR